ncbi:bifunctional peptidase and arginyl-hydroxylase JMJD5-like [Homalodisca vitripennis]|uniref:bifunctional peptidase and arginyl-hydroxylase JMJD5-like n=1 Tax=Homalodisca vitripennis TaxID=197043 RepID=UPI001EEB5473|nr:bifunctional peptidase and arginyl-hydroxylase JMJD5-like [Homalodisca vitripennis]
MFTMDGNIEMVNLLKPILSMCLTKQEIQMQENISPDVEYLLLKSLDLLTDLRYTECIEKVQTVIDITWEELNTGHWSMVPESQRSVYSTASLLKVVALVHQAVQESADSSLSFLKQAVKTADLGLLLGNSHRDQLTSAAKVLSEAINQAEPKLGSSVHETLQSSDIPHLQVVTDPIVELHSPSLETFSSQHFYPRVPVKITGCMSHWPALRRWSDLDYLLEKAGSRTVPVELGSSYSHADWSQQLMTLRQFVTQYVAGANKSPGYLAQHQLFDQVPELKQDIVVPDYCACSDIEDGEVEVDINAWFGPSGTVSPLHHDPKHNLLCQVVGRKQVTLYSPTVSDCLYPHEGRLLSNTAQVDPEAPDYQLFPKYRDTQATLCLLSPGDMVYIPPTWWHHVRALDLSFSVSFWWL